MEGNVTLVIDDLTEEEAVEVLKYSEYREALDDVKQMIRGEWKYGDLEGDVYEKVDELYTKFFGILEKGGISL